MPPRKKVRGKLSKAEKTKKVSEKLRASCKHLSTSANLSQTDWDVCFNLHEKFGSKVKSLRPIYSGSEWPDTSNSLSRITDSIYTEYYYHLNDKQKQLFRDLMISTGTIQCIVAANRRDLTQPDPIFEATNYLYLVTTIEIRDKHGGSLNQNIANEVMYLRHNLLYCPRETVRFFHRRNPCDCLQDIYYHLKETTKRVVRCERETCPNLQNTKEILECSNCKAIQYCSEECAMADWPRHKEECKQIKKLLDGVDSGNYISQKASFCCYCQETKCSSEIKKCSQCKLSQYCSRECQVAHWPQHKELCKKMKKSSSGTD